LKKKHHKHHHKHHEEKKATTAATTGGDPPKKDEKASGGKEEQILGKMKTLEAELAKKEEAVKGVVTKGRIEVNGPLPADFAERFAQGVAKATGCDPSEVKVIETNPVVALLQTKASKPANSAVYDLAPPTPSCSGPGCGQKGCPPAMPCNCYCQCRPPVPSKAEAMKSVR